MIKTSLIEVLLTEDEFLEGKHLEWPIVRVLGNNGIAYLLYKLSHGRNCLVQVGKIEGFKGESVLKEELNLLPGGKVPLILLKQIEKFFREVMKIPSASRGGHGNFEAMAHIVWSPKGGYRVAIPEQTVSVTSAAYNWDHIREDEVVVIDIHSHNSMGAFFSGTDDRDDSTYFGISGVFGKLNNPVADTVCRINFGKTKVTGVNLLDFFEGEEDNIDVSEWLKLVKTPVSRNWSNWGNQEPLAPLISRLKFDESNVAWLLYNLILEEQGPAALLFPWSELAIEEEELDYETPEGWLPTVWEREVAQIAHRIHGVLENYQEEFVIQELASMISISEAVIKRHLSLMLVDLEQDMAD